MRLAAFAVFAGLLLMTPGTRAGNVDRVEKACARLRAAYQERLTPGKRPAMPRHPGPETLQLQFDLIDQRMLEVFCQ